MKISIYKNQHGTWHIARMLTSGGYRWELSLWVNGVWILIANQGRRKTCLELADAGYRVKEMTNESA